ncbi:uncharacterized protein LOC129806695 [Phlebotomus papatasi]|uniref:uncharacterized protein LOC129806695 n=1 Tax=Phlebotomus papatasi TaxID=29031 RepID=UPI0024833F52|nr:uncharacterized protein LOC129806695 [Phlebotomus papatasi]
MSENNSDIDYFHEEVDVEELVSSVSSQEPQYVVHCVETAAETLKLLKEWQMPSSVVHKILGLNLTVEDISNLIESDLNTIFAPDQLRDKIRFRTSLNNWRRHLPTGAASLDCCEKVVSSDQSASSHQIEKATYYIPRPPGGYPRGTFYDKYRNLRRSYIKKGYINKRARVKSVTYEIHESEDSDPAVDQGSSLHDLKLWLSSNFEPLQQVQENWTNTFPLRCPAGQKHYELTISEIMSEWPILKTAVASILINLDFAIVNPVAGSLETHWETFCGKVLNHVSGIGNKHNAENPDSWDIECMLGLHKLLPPSFSKTAGKSGKKKWTIADSQKSQVLFIPVLNDLETVMNQRRQEGKIQPFVVIIGTQAQPTGFFVYLDGHFLKFSKFVEAVDICFKIFHLFNVEYPDQSITVWEFISRYFYQIKSTTKQIPKVENLLNKFQVN